MALGSGYISAFDNFINRLLIEPAGDLVKGAVQGISNVGGGLLAGVSGAFEGIGNIGSMFTLGGSTSTAPEVAETPKLGLNAAKQQNLQLADTSPFAASFDNIQVPTVGAKGAMQGAGMNV